MRRLVCFVPVWTSSKSVAWHEELKELDYRRTNWSGSIWGIALAPLNSKWCPLSTAMWKNRFIATSVLFLIPIWRSSVQSILQSSVWCDWPVSLSDDAFVTVWLLKTLSWLEHRHIFVSCAWSKWIQISWKTKETHFAWNECNGWAGAAASDWFERYVAKSREAQWHPRGIGTNYSRASVLSSASCCYQN